LVAGGGEPPPQFFFPFGRKASFISGMVPGLSSSRNGTVFLPRFSGEGKGTRGVRILIRVGHGSSASFARQHGNCTSKRKRSLNRKKKLFRPGARHPGVLIIVE